MERDAALLSFLLVVVLAVVVVAWHHRVVEVMVKSPNAILSRYLARRVPEEVEEAVAVLDHKVAHEPAPRHVVDRAGQLLEVLRHGHPEVPAIMKSAIVKVVVASTRQPHMTI